MPGLRIGWANKSFSRIYIRWIPKPHIKFGGTENLLDVLEEYIHFCCFGFIDTMQGFLSSLFVYTKNFPKP